MEMSINIETVTTETCTMDYFRFGNGEKTLVVLPGLSIKSVMGSADAIASAYQSLGNAFTVYVFDRRKDMPATYSVRDMAHDTATVFKALGLKDVCIFGASQGGMIALVIAIEHPELVGKIALGSSSAHVNDDQFKVIRGWIDLAKRKDTVGLYLEFGKEIYPPEVFELYKDALVSAAATVTDEDLKRFIITAEGTRDFNVVDELPLIKCPVLALGVFEDSVLDSDATMEIAENLDYRMDFSLYMYIGFGHAAFDTAPDYHERLLKFFTD